jgi:S1-C subfamily serine protease
VQAPRTAADDQPTVPQQIAPQQNPQQNPPQQNVPQQNAQQQNLPQDNAQQGAPQQNPPQAGAPWNPYAAQYPQQPTHNPYAQRGGDPYAATGQHDPYGYYAGQGRQQPNQQQGAGHYPAPNQHQQPPQQPYAGTNPYAAPARDAFGAPLAGGAHNGGGQPPYGGFPPNGAGQYPWPPSPAVRRRRRAIALIAGAFATAAIFGVATSFGIAAATGDFGSGTSNASSQGSSSGNSLGNGFGSSGEGSGSSGGESGLGGSGQGSATSGTLPSATSTQEVGVVDIVSQLTYDSAESAGTGLILTSDGEILTNNHVVEDATSISVTVITTGKTYTAKVVGTDETDDVAVLKLQDATGLTKANINSSASATVGEAVTGVGNAGGTGGTPSAAAGTIVATGQSITTEAEESAKSESLTGLIETNADIQAGDSGGPLYNSSNQVIGIDTAASEGSSQTQGYAIPISSALSLANKIEAGDASSTILIGYPAFLGVEVAADSASTGSESSGGSAGGTAGGFGSEGGLGESQGGLGESQSGDGESTGGGTTGVSGAAVEQVISGTPADSAGIVAGDTITAVNGTTISSSAALSAALANYKVGQSVTITWVDSTGASHSASVTLTQGPAA